MIKDYFYLFFLLLLFYYLPTTKAQDFILKSELNEKGKTQQTHTLLNYDSTGFYALRFDKEFSYSEIEHYAPNLKFQKKYVVTRQKRRYIGVVNIANQSYLLYFRYKENKSEKTHEKVSLYAKKILKDSFVLENDSIELIAPFKMVGNYYRGNFAVSPDRSKILVYDYEEEGDIPGVHGLTNKITLRVFDSSFRKLWQREVNLSPSGSSKRKVSIKKMRINNQGKVAILTDIFKEYRTYNLRQITAAPTLFFVGQQQKEYALFQPELGDYFFNEIDFTFDKQGNILWFGFFSKFKYYQQSGFFFIKINQDRTKVLIKKIHHFGSKQIAQLLNRKKIGKNAEGRFYKLIHWTPTESGGLVLSAEHQPPSNYTFKSNAILVLQLNAEGELDWFNHFYKVGNEPLKTKIFLSHCLFTQGENTYILYNQGLYSDGAAWAIRIDKKGEHSSRIFYKYTKQQELFCPSLSFKLKSPKVFLCLQDRFNSAYRFALLDIEKLFDEN